MYGIPPVQFTLKNRLIMGMPETGIGGVDSADDGAKMLPGRMPPLNLDMSLAKSKFLGRFTIPCEDSEESRSVIRALSGKANADRRRKSLHRRGNTETPTYDISFWLPPDSDSYKTQYQWEKSLSEFASSVRSNVRCEVRQIGKEFVNTSGRRARAFRICYWYGADGSEDNEDGELTNEDAKAIHRDIYAKVPIKYPGAECR
mmetsp:Transcript_25631/g.61612  ORF Transcript_25631/g.61612 Transcript_25631/m.61612 type:complete len:202 (-) Transcript_25631:63-668(-)